MNIFLRELRAHRRGLIIWNVCLLLGLLSGMAKYTAYTSAAGNGPSINDLLKTMPASVKALLGFGSFDVATMAGYFAVLFIYIELTVAIHAAIIGAGIIAKEESDKTTEFLMVKPVSRTTVITAKLLAALFNIVVLNVVTLLCSLAIVPAYNKSGDISDEIVAMMGVMLIVQLLFMTLGAVLAAVMKNPKGAGSLATGILLIGYFIARVTDINDKLDALNVLSPFKYFSLPDIIAGKGLNAIIVVISVLLVAAFTAVTYVFYTKRDLRI
jgi:ABC-2 type transport system permease protein